MTEKKTAAKAPAKKTAAPKKTAGRKKAASVAEFDAKSIKELKKEERAPPPQSSFFLYGSADSIYYLLLALPYRHRMFLNSFYNFFIIK